MVAVSEAPDHRQEVLAALSTDAIAAVLTGRGDRFVVHDDGRLAGRWGDTVISFDCTGVMGEVLHIRAIPERRFTADRLVELYEFCNGWNHDRLLPKAYVHELGDGQLLIAGEVITDLEHGVTAGQLTVMIQTAISASAALADALDRLP